MATVAKWPVVDPEQIPEPRLHKYIAAALGLLVAWAAYMYSTQFINGLGVTGLNKPVFWGIYIANFIFCVGLSAGGIAVSALVHLLEREDMKPVAIMAEVMATSFLALAAGFIIMDLGEPTRLLYVFRSPNFSSPLLWDVTVITSYMLLCLALLYFSARSVLVEHRSRGKWRWAVRAFTLGHTSLSERARRWDRRLLRTLAIVSIPGAVALHSVTAWILGLVKGQPGWNTPILAPLFIASALVSGLAGVVLAVIAGRRLFKLEVSQEVVLSLARYLLALIPVLMYLLFSEFLTVGYSGTPTHLQVFHEILFGRFSRIFWFDVIVGTVIPLLLLGLPWTRNSTKSIALACVMVIVGVFAERTYVLLPSLMRPALGPGVVTYAPSPVEWSMMVGAYSLGLLIFTALMALLFGFRFEGLPRRPRYVR